MDDRGAKSRKSQALEKCLSRQEYHMKFRKGWDQVLYMGIQRYPSNDQELHSFAVSGTILSDDT